jgi:hypothetical protein
LSNENKPGDARRAQTKIWKINAAPTLYLKYNVKHRAENKTRIKNQNLARVDAKRNWSHQSDKEVKKAAPNPHVRSDNITTQSRIVFRLLK